MKINDIIRTRRQALGMTQEALADKLGVSPPAVNKWERALNYPDITLLPTLARTLEVDLNTLLSFQEDMSREEIGLFLQELTETARAEGRAAAFRLARNKLWEFPHNDLLSCNVAGILEGILALYPDGSEEERQSQEQEVAALYERAVRSVDPKIREWASYILASRCVGRGELGRAESLLEQLSDTYRGRAPLMAYLREKQGRRQESWVLLETELFTCANGILTVLTYMIDLALKDEERDDAKLFADTAAAVGARLDLSDFAVLSAPMQLLWAEKDGPRTLALLEKMLESMAAPWELSASPLYRHLPPKKSASEAQELLVQPMLNQLETAPECAFLKDVPGYEELLEKFRS